VHFSKKSGGTANQLNSNTKELPVIPVRGLIDQDTPKEMYTSKSLEDGSEYTLVFSDEFNTEGRSFYPGDDPYWVGEDLHYWQV
jgi:beta-glucan synthesis-associated protein KRE6